jgi:hypothetical protein
LSFLAREKRGNAPRGSPHAAGQTLVLLSRFRVNLGAFFDELNSSVAHAFALAGLPVYLASSQFGSILWLTRLRQT